MSKDLDEMTMEEINDEFTSYIKDQSDPILDYHRNHIKQVKSGKYPVPLYKDSKYLHICLNEYIKELRIYEISRIRDNISKDEISFVRPTLQGIVERYKKCIEKLNSGEENDKD